MEDVSYTPASFAGVVIGDPGLNVRTVTVAPGTAAPVVSVTVPLMSPWFTACPKAVANDPARKIPASKANLPDFIPNLPKIVAAVYSLDSLASSSPVNPKDKRLSFVTMAAREQYNRKPHKVVKDYLDPMESLVIKGQPCVLRQKSTSTSSMIVSFCPRRLARIRERAVMQGKGIPRRQAFLWDGRRGIIRRRCA